MRLVCVVLKGTTEYYNDTKNLLDYGFNNFQKLTLSSDILAQSDSLASYLKDQGLLDAAVELPPRMSLWIPPRTSPARQNLK